jgi:hypothetical protein
VIEGATMKRGAVPKRILTVREFREYSPWDTPRYRVVDAVRVLRAWLADPSVPDELRVGDADLLTELQVHLKERGQNRISLITREQLEAERSGKGQTRH